MIQKYLQENTKEVVKIKREQSGTEEGAGQGLNTQVNREKSRSSLGRGHR